MTRRCYKNQKLIFVSKILQEHFFKDKALIDNVIESTLDKTPVLIKH